MIVDMPTPLVGTTPSISLIHQLLPTLITSLCSFCSFCPINSPSIGRYLGRRPSVNKLLLTIGTAT